MSTISIIVAIADDRAIGKNNDLLWHLSADMKHFKGLTTGHTIIMGRKTFESLPKGGLPNRTNLVLTSATEKEFLNASACKSIEDALKLCHNEEEVFIIGGASIYNQSIDIADKMYITRVHAEFPDADTFFPDIDWSQWKEVEKEDFTADEKNPFDYSFVTYLRK